MKNTKKIALAAMSLVAAGVAAAGATGTFAWFAANNKVTVDGMAVTTRVASNLLIAGDTLASTTKIADTNFTNVLNQARVGKIEPVSSINGTSFWYTNDAKADGSRNFDIAADGEYVQYAEDTSLAYAAVDKTQYDDAFQTAYGVTESITTSNVMYGYIDYTFQIKAVAVADSYLNLTRLDLFTPGKDGSKAMRVAVFTEDISSANPAGGVGNLQRIFSVDGATNFTTGKAVSAAQALNTVQYASDYRDDTNDTLAKLDAGSTSYFKVVVRMWLEGEDTTCNSETFLELTDAWNLELDMAIESANTNAVTEMNKIRHAAAVDHDGNGETATKELWANAAATEYYNTKADAIKGENGVTLTGANNNIRNAFGLPDNA